MKKLVVLTAACLLAVQLRADLGSMLGKAKELAGDTTSLLLKTKEYPADTTTSFEMKNKSGSVVYFAVKSDDTFVEEKGSQIFSVPSGSTKDLPVDIDKVTTIAMWRETKPTSSSEEPEMTYSVVKGKTLYLTWDGSVLRPQTGPAKGMLGKTDTGLSTKNNVTKADITKG